MVDETISSVMLSQCYLPSYAACISKDVDLLSTLFVMKVEDDSRFDNAVAKCVGLILN